MKIESVLPERTILSCFGQQPHAVDTDCNYNSRELISLQGSSQIVDGNFYCCDNPLTSLEGGPIKVLGDFYCQRTELKDLTHAPTRIGGTFYCDDKLPLIKFLMTSSIDWFHSNMRCANIVNPYLSSIIKLSRANALKLQQELIEAGFEEEAKF